MNAYVMIEGTRVYPNAVPIADYMSAGARRLDATRGSRKLLKAILKAQRPPVRKNPTLMVKRSWAVRKTNRERVRLIIRIATEHFGLGPRQLAGKRGSADIARMRQIAMFVARDVVGASYPDIGACFNRDHTTVLHACRVIGGDPSALEDINALRAWMK
jgi:chromosomal replication initiator protein